ncbi:energy-coupled thiamine transporter ThiT [Aquibacillus kalidii]|uniref:energy-coupled thiamine transporter ThiT n=1 Tax=Aquibacillus kalidii TaxID=2762597 RepID=UPI0016496E5D|nr:energy-coupled thiamine transporter ThiT [Aquibacillus kalidii]
MDVKRTLFLVEVAIFASFAIVLDLIPFLSFKIWPQGGSVSLAMIPIFLVAFRWGTKGGLLAGLLYGLLQLIIEPHIRHWLQAILEYGVAFAGLGLAGLFAKQARKAISAENSRAFIRNVIMGVLLGCSVRYLAHILAGVVFFKEYAPEGIPVWWYSITYNGTYMLPSFIICTVAVWLLFSRQPRLIKI